MLAKVSTKALLDALAKVSVAIPKKSVLPIITNVLIKAEKGQLTLAGTNLDVLITTSCPAEVKKRGSTCVPVVELTKFLKLLKKDSTVELNAANTFISCSSGTFKTILPNAVPEDFPPIIDKPKGSPVKVEGFAKALHEVDYARAKEESRPVLTSVCVSQKGKALELAATDGFRMAITKLNAKGRLPRILLHREFVNVVQKLKVDTASLFFKYQGDTPSMVYLVAGNIVIIGMLVEGTYPDYPQLVPKHKKMLKTDVNQLKEAVKTVSANIDKSGIIRLQSKKAQLTVAHKNEDSTASMEIPSSGSIKIALNYKYLLDVLNRHDQNIQIRTKQPSEPALIQKNGTTHVLMPMFVQW